MAELRPLSLVASAALLAGACAGGPRLDAAVAEDLAARADALAASLEAGDACAAREAGGGLVATAAAARDRGEVPPDVAAEVIDTTRSVVAGLACPPPAEEEPAPEPPAPGDEDDDDTEDDEKAKDEDDEKEKGEGRKGRRGKGGD